MWSYKDHYLINMHFQWGRMGEGGRGGGESPGDYKAGRTLISFQQEGNRCMKLFELNFFKRKTFLQMIKPAGQNHPHSQSIFLVLCQAVVKPLGGRCISLPRRHSLSFSHNLPPPQTSAEAKGTFLAFCLLMSWLQRSSMGTGRIKGQGMFPWLQQTFVGDDDCMTSPKNVCIGGCRCMGRRSGREHHSLVYFQKRPKMSHCYLDLVSS